jgi:hypothetical protein
MKMYIKIKPILSACGSWFSNFCEKGKLLFIEILTVNKDIMKMYIKIKLILSACGAWFSNFCEKGKLLFIEILTVNL